MKLTLLDSSCDKGPCPTVDSTDTDVETDVETAVCIPIELLVGVARDRLS
ncbi:hypothetical protein [Kitasatospora purpeofusca]